MFLSNDENSGINVYNNNISTYMSYYLKKNGFNKKSSLYLIVHNPGQKYPVACFQGQCTERKIASLYLGERK